jgi:Na+/H+ antiporter NhaC
MNNLGIATVFPFAIAIFVLLWQEDVKISLLGGLVLGGFILSKFNPLLGLYSTASDLVLGSLLNARNIILIGIIVGVLVLFSLLDRYGYINVFTKKATAGLKSSDQLEVIVYLSSLLVFIDRHLSSLLVGAFTKPMAEKKSLSPLKHAYLLNTVSSSISTLIPLTLLTPVILTGIGTAFKGLSIEFSPIKALYLSLPYQFFNIFSFFTAATLLVVKRDVLFMKRLTRDVEGDQRTLSFGLSINTRARPESRTAFYGVIAALAILFGVITGGLLMNRGNIIMPSVQPLQNYGPLFVNAIFVSIIFVLLYLILSRTTRYTELRNTTTGRGINIGYLHTTLLYIILAFSMEMLARRLSLGSNLMGGLVSNNIPARFIPLILFMLTCLVSFLSGSAPLTISALLPVALRIMSANMTDPQLVDRFIYATIGAVISGATFGDMNSPLSLNYIITTAVTNSGIRYRFVTQIGYSFIALGATVVFGYLLFTLNLKPYVSISSGFLIIALLLMFLSNTMKKQ